MFEEVTIPFENSVLIFFLILVIILISPFLLKKLKIPGIIGLIISGIIIGPHGLNLLEKNSAVDLFSTIGLLYLMFIAGLDLDLNEFKKHRYKSIGFGVLTFLIPMFTGIATCLYIIGYDWIVSLLIGSMLATHTLIAYPVVSKFGISRNEAVAVTVGGTIITDTTVLLILAVIIGSANGDLTGGFWIRMIISVLIFAFIIFFIIPKIAKWFFNKLESERTSHFIFVLSIVFLSAFLAELAGLEAIIGAFGAGLAVNRLIPYNSVLMNRLDFVGNALFIPFFLISVGMLVDIKAFFIGTDAVLVAIILTITAIIGKWLAAYITQLLFRFSRAQRRLIFGLSSSRAAATLAIILIGFKTGIVDENLLNGTIILILITCIAGSLVTEKAALEITMTEEVADPSKNEKNIAHEKILIPVAAFKNMESYINLATLLTDHTSGSGITLLSVVENDPKADENIEIVRKWHQKAYREALSHEVFLETIITIDINIISGILRASREISASTILLGWPGKIRFIDKLFGLKTDGIINNSDRKIIVYRSDKPVNIHTKALMILPPLSEYEPGFTDVIQLFTHFSVVSKTKMIYYGTEKTLNFINKYFKEQKNKTSPEYTVCNDWSDFKGLSGAMKEDDLLIFMNARRGSVSYNENMESIPVRLEKFFPDNSIILVYPGIGRRTGRFEDYGDMDTRPLENSIGKIGRWIKLLSRGQWR